MIEELVDYKHWNDAKKKIDIINQIEINVKANRSVEPNHPKFPGIELFCHIYDIDIYFSDYIAANLMKIQNALMPPPEEPKEPKKRKKTQPEPDQNIKDEEDDDGNEEYKSVKFENKPKGRTFEVDEEDKIEELPEQEVVDEDGEENASVGKIKQIDIRSKSDVEEVQGPQRKNVNRGPPKIDQRVLLVFDKMRITIGEVASEEQVKDSDYDHIIDTHRSEIPHMNILEMILEGLEIEYDSGTAMNLHLIMTRLYMKDLQKVPDVRKSLVIGAKNLIPPCYQMILSNPEFEKEIDDNSSHYTMITKSYRTDDFKSIRDEEEGSFVNPNSQNINNQLRLFVKIENQTTDVEFLFSNLRLVVTLPIIERLSKFGEKIQNLQKESEEAKMKAKVMEVSRILNEEDEEDSDSDDMDGQMRKTDMKQLVQASMAKENEKQEEQKGIFERLREEREKYLMQGKELKIKIIDENSRMNAKGRLKNFEMWIPLDSTDEYSRVLSLSLSLQVSYKTTSLVKHRINEILNQLIDSTLHKDQQDASVMINQFMIIMYNRHLLQVQDDLTTEKLLLPSRISMIYDKFFNLAKDSDITNIEMTIEPFDMKVGFRELENFQQIQKLFNDFQERMNKTEVNVDDAVAIEEQQEIDEKDIVKNMEKENVTQQNRVSFRERKSKQLIKMNVRIISESINFALMDDTGKHEYPLINFNISKIIADIEQETGADDAASFILKKMGISKHPYLKLDAGLLLESNYFNISSGSYEPLIEPWTFTSEVMQKTPASAMVVDLKSEEMLDICVTYGMALALKRLQTKMGQQSGQWEDEKKVEEARAKTKRITQAKSTYSNKLSKAKSVASEDEADDAAGFLFENNLGIAIRITLENYESWIEQGIPFNDQDKEMSVIEFQEWETGEESRNVRFQRDLISLNKYVKKQQNGGKFIESFEDQILRYDIYIRGFEPIHGVPIEITGLRSYELIPEGANLKKKKPKYQHAIVVNVSPEGNKKLVSFESQLIFTNKTEHDFDIAHVFPQGTTVIKEEMTADEINACVEELKVKDQQDAPDTRQSGYKFHDVDPFSTVFASTDYKVPLSWFLDEVDVFYK